MPSYPMAPRPDGRGGGGEQEGKKKREERELHASTRDAYRKRTGRLFPNWSEVFALLHELGYKRVERAA